VTIREFNGLIDEDERTGENHLGLNERTQEEKQGFKRGEGFIRMNGVYIFPELKEPEEMHNG